MKRFKKFIAIVLSALMLSSCIAVGFSGGAVGSKAPMPKVMEAYEATADYPLIILPGINHSTSYVANEDGTPAVNADGKELSGGLLIIDDAGLVGKLLKKLLWPLLSSLFMQFDNGLSKAAYEVVCDLFSLQSCDNEGNQIHNLKTYSYDYPVSQMDDDTRDWFYRMLPVQEVTKRIGENNVYLYTFPLVGDPMESARGLVDYIEMVKAQCGVEKVNIATVSLGGTILTAYADIINGDWSNVNAIINAVGLLGGTDIIADFFERKWNLADEFLYSEYARNIMKQTNGSETLGCLINVALRLFSRPTLEKLLTGAFSGILETLLLNNPQFWAMLPADRYDVLAERYLSDDDHAVLRAKTDAFQQARLNLKDNLLEANRKGISVDCISGYNLSYTDGEYCFFGIVDSASRANSDGIIPVASTTLGASSVAARTEFSEEYLAGKNQSYISPEKSVDASTCLFPDHVWFFANQHHEIGGNDVALKLMALILTGEITDVNSSSEYPQFNGCRNTKKLTRDYFKQAQQVIANEEGTYTAEQIAAVQEAYDAAMVVFNNTVLGADAQQKVDEVTSGLEKALVNAGVREAGKDDSNVLEPILEKGITGADYCVLKLFKGNGFFDWSPYGKINQSVVGSLTAAK